MTIEIDEEDLDAATDQVVAAIERSTDRILECMERLIDATNGQTAAVTHELRELP